MSIAQTLSLTLRSGLCILWMETTLDESGFIISTSILLELEQIS